MDDEKMTSEMTSEITSEMTPEIIPKGETTGEASTSAVTESSLNQTPFSSEETISSQLDGRASSSIDSTLLDVNVSLQNDLPFGFEHFWAHTDIITQVLFFVLIIMSLISWFIIFQKFLQGFFESSRSRRFLKQFWQARSLMAIEKSCHLKKGNNDYERLTCEGLNAIKRYTAHEGTLLERSGSLEDMIIRSLRSKLDAIQVNNENGVTALASIAGAAPFVGLFGTVWGIYHALIEIGATGAGTIDKVAGPVGEALIMTGLGLAVAIPALIAHSWVSRKNRVKMGALDTFAFELFNILNSRRPREAESPSPLPLSSSQREPDNQSS